MLCHGIGMTVEIIIKLTVPSECEKLAIQFVKAQVFGV